MSIVEERKRTQEQLNIGKKLHKYSVLYLKDKGWTNEKIAIELGMTEGIVRLIVKKYGDSERR